MLRTTDFLALLHSLGGVITEETNYGFLAQIQGILLDCEPCIHLGEGYELEGLPPGTCPLEFTGSVGGKLLRCTSWEAILWIIFTTLKKFHKVNGERKTFLVLFSPKSRLGKVQHNSYMNFIGITDINFVHVENDEYGGEKLADSIAKARTQIVQLVGR